jgi:hypothetical protein
MLAAGVATVRAQERPANGMPPDAPPPEWEAPLEHPPEESPLFEPARDADKPGMQRQARRGHRRDPVSMWLQRLKKENPEEFERMRYLHQDNPRRFKHMLRMRLQCKYFEHVLAEYPPMLAAYNALPSDVREQFVQQVYSPPPPLHARERRQRQARPEGDAPGDGDPETAAVQQQVRALALTYRETEDPEVREKKAGELRRKLEILFDLRNKGRRQRIAHIEERVSELQAKLDQREDRREDIIQRRLEDLTERDVLKW